MTWTIAIAEVPKVAVDIPPMHSLVAQVMDGVGAPTIILPPGADPHGYAIRPSEARSLNEAEIVFWLGENLTPWLKRAIDSLAGDSVVIELLRVDGLSLLSYRDTRFTRHEADGHDHEDTDPHAWLDPDNAKVWLDIIAVTLSKADPANAGTYLYNAANGKDELDSLTAELSAMMQSIHGKPFIVFHDAYQYFEARFGIKTSGAIFHGDASDPGPAHLLKIKDTLRNLGVLCVFSETLYKPDFVSILIEKTGIRHGRLDPMGAHLELGKDLYFRLLRNLSEDLVSCLG
jgi:zinc transport system substrate-binding protein